MPPAESSLPIAPRLALILVPVLVLANVPSALADSLASLFDHVLEFEGQLEQSPQFRKGLESVIVSFQRNAVRTADFVATSTTSGYAYTWDPETGSFKRTATSRGSVYVEPADTVGKGHAQVSFSYLYSNFTNLDGKSLEDTLDEGIRNVRGPNQSEVDVRTATFSFRSQVFSLSGTFGLTDRWDVNLLIPVFLTTLKLNGTSFLLIPGIDPIPNNFVENESKLGVGDLLIRTKYRFEDEFGLQLASELILRAPSGNPDNFQGLGDVTLTPVFIVQRAFGPHLLRANLGVEVNAGEVSQSRARYAVSAAFQLLPPLGVSVDIVGSSGFAPDHFKQGDVSGVVDRTDIVDAIVGFQISITQQVVAQVGTIIPLTKDGLRADVVPAGWIGGRF